MATIKAFSDLQQSKKLAEILPPESADMGWNVFVDDTTRILPINDWNLVKDGSGNVKFYHAWSLAALFGVLPEKYTELIKEGGMYRIIIKDSYMTCLFENPIDACVAMIEKLHKLSLL